MHFKLSSLFSGPGKDVKIGDADAAVVNKLKALGKTDQACTTLDQLRSEFPRLPQNVKKIAEMIEKQCKKVGED